MNHEIVVVDDGSEDNTRLNAQKYARKNGHVKIIAYNRNLGKGFAVKTGFFGTVGDAIVFLDSDLDIEIKFKESRPREFLLSISAIGGVALGLLLELFSSFDLELVFILYSFISGVILYTIVREVIPEKEKGKPIYFIMGALGFTVIIMFINIFTTLIQLG